jgi:hypothetical protein
MDAIITAILSAGGSEVVKKAITVAMDTVLRRKKSKVTASDKKKIEQAAEKMIQAATIADVHRYSPLVRRLDVESARAYRSGPAKHAPVKHGAAKRVFRKSARKAVVARKAPTKRASAKKRS